MEIDPAKNSARRCSYATCGRVEHFAGPDVERREQIDGAVPFVVMGHRLCTTRLDRERRLCTIERLALRFLIETEHDGAFGGSR